MKFEYQIVKVTLDNFVEIALKFREEGWILDTDFSEARPCWNCKASLLVYKKEIK